MPFFIVTMAHPHGSAWEEHLSAHIRFLQGRVRDGTLVASGPLKDSGLRSGFLIVRATSRDEVQSLIAADPFAVAGLIVGLTINEWDPLFGVFASESSGRLAGQDLSA